jgi:flagellar FliL protein
MEQREALRQETTDIIRKTLAKMEQGDKGHGASAEKEHSEESKAEHAGGFKEAYFTEFLVD